MGTPTHHSHRQGVAFDVHACASAHPQCAAFCAHSPLPSCFLWGSRTPFAAAHPPPSTPQLPDNMDGKQARRTGSSSPLGLLFDHGTLTCVERVCVCACVVRLLASPHAMVCRSCRGRGWVVCTPSMHCGMTPRFFCSHGCVSPAFLACAGCDAANTFLVRLPGSDPCAQQCAVFCKPDVLPSQCPQPPPPSHPPPATDVCVWLACACPLSALRNAVPVAPSPDFFRGRRRQLSSVAFCCSTQVGPCRAPVRRPVRVLAPMRLLDGFYPTSPPRTALSPPPTHTQSPPSLLRVHREAFVPALRAHTLVCCPRVLLPPTAGSPQVGAEDMSGMYMWMFPGLVFYFATWEEYVFADSCRPPPPSPLLRSHHTRAPFLTHTHVFPMYPPFHG
jgi:hypothetical protein